MLNLQIHPNQTSCDSSSLGEDKRYWYTITTSGVSMEI